MGDGKVVVVTGSNKGIGFCVVKQILQQHPNWICYLTARDKERGEEAVKKLKDEHNLTAHFHQLDIDSFESVRKLRDFLKNEHPKGIDVLVNNAAVLAKPFDGSKFDMAKVGMTINTDYFNTLHLCNELFPLLAPGARVVTVSSRLSQVCFANLTQTMQQKIRNCTNVDQVSDILMSLLAADWAKLEESGWTTKPPTFKAYNVFLLGIIFPYAMSKVGLNTLTTIFQKKFDDEGNDVVINCGCPGMVKTDLNPYGSKTPDEGADTLVYLALLPPGTPIRGKFVAERKEIDHFDHISSE